MAHDDPKNDIAGAAPLARTDRKDPASLISLLASLGLFVSLVLEYVHVTTYLRPAADSFCSMGSNFDCTAVAASPYSVFLGVPWALWGALGFSSILVASFQRSIWLLALTGVAAGASIALLGFSLFAIGSLCYLCEATHLLAWILFYLSWKDRKRLHGTFRDTSPLLPAVGPTAGIGLAMIFLLPAYWSSFSYKGEPPFATGVTEEGHPWIGSASPKLTIEEFVDYRCPHCKIGSARTLRVLGKHPDWRIVRRQQPRIRTCSAQFKTCLSARAAYCAQEQGKFWRADRWLFAHLNPKKEVDTEQLALDLKLDTEKFAACVESDPIYERANKEALQARKAKIVDIPGYRVDGKRLKPDEAAKLLK